MIIKSLSFMCWTDLYFYSLIRILMFVWINGFQLTHIKALKAVQT